MANEAVRGLSQAKRAFKALPDVTREALADATDETADYIRAAAVRRVPVRYGFLQQAIAKKMSRKTGVAIVGIARGAHTLPTGETVDPSKYGKFQEFGTEHHPAQPFMIPAAEEQREPYLNRCRDAGKKIERDMATFGSRNL